MLESDNWYSNAINSGVDYVMGLGGYDTTRRGYQGNGDATGRAPGDNSFYRDNADWMPGWGNTFGLDFLDPNGHPSGATAQDRATNYVGHSDPTGIWTDVRANLVTNESAAIGRAAAAGEDHIGFTDVYDAHVHAYADAQAAHPSAGAGNTFIDPASFGLAVYGAPLMEHFGINAGPITGASIDAFNDPTDSVGDGWAKRMGLSAMEIGGGGALLGAAGMDAMEGDLGTAALEGAAGLGSIGLGLFSGAWNTGTAVANGMSVGDAASGLVNVGGSLLDAGATAAGDAVDGMASLGGSAIDGVSSLGSSAASIGGGLLDDAGSAISSLWD
ncbi:MAG: hypothetical protein KC464_24335 [Myxococcales bacterium]|nr:hypothetical protein [Myxococcales bacterium]